MSGANKHPYHLVEASPWPAVGAAAAFTAAIGGVMYMHEVAHGVSVLAAGFALVLATMFMWWRDIIREAEYQGHHTPIVQIGMRYGMMLFIASEVMFFVAFFWAFFDRALFPMDGIWPPEGIETFNPFDLPLINTLVLLLSGCTVTWAHHALQHGNRRDFMNGLGITILLGALFTGLQAIEYSHAP
ncbi:MAG: cytochrome c oxidase subunit 3, partial [Candidatus Puniceispirillaceae bacterium]